MADDVTSRREWRVWARWGEGEGAVMQVSRTAEGANRFIALAHRDWPNATVEIEEVEIITRRVERRVVPRGEA